MPSLVKPPIGPLDRGLAQALGVAALFLFQDDAGTAYDAISGQSVLTTGTVVQDDAGKVVAFNGTSQAARLLAFPLPSSVAGNYLVCGKIKATANQGANPGSAFGLSASATTQTGAGIGFNGTTTTTVGGTVLTGSLAGMGATSAASLNTWYHVYAQNAGGGVPSYAWINGLPASTNQGTAVAGAVAAVDTIVFGAQRTTSAFTRFFHGDIEWGSVIYLGPSAPAFTDPQAAVLFAMDFPACLFNNRKKRWLWTAGAGGGPVALLGRGAGMGQGRAVLAGAAALAGRGMAMAQGRAVLGPVAPLAAAGAAVAQGRAVLTPATAIAGRGQAAAQGRAALAAAAALAGRGQAAAQGKGFLNAGTVALSGRGQAAAQGRGTLSTGSVAAGQPPTVFPLLGVPAA